MRRPLAVALLLAAGCGGSGTPPAPLVPATREPAASADWWNGAVVYEVFVRSFRDSNGDGNGDLQGLIQKLDDLNDGNPDTDTDLGVDAIWLMPIYPSPSYHGYDVTDYDGVNPEYGTAADMDALVAACHARGIRVILDWVPNHTSNEHPWFVDSRSSTGSARRAWYVWSPIDRDWTQPWNGGQTTWYPGTGGWYYAIFWSGMPDLNWENLAVRTELGAAAGRWMARGVDGFRLDAVRYLVENGSGAGQMDQPETHQILRDFAAGVRATPGKADALVLGEAWADTTTIASYFGSTATIPSGDEVLPFDFPLADAILSGIQGGSARDIAAALDSVARTYPAGTGDAPFLTNHDQIRVATRLGADPAKLGLAAAILLTLQGTPIVYYGEEIGTRNGDCGSDECKRTPMAWDGTPKGGFTSGTPWWPLSPGTATANWASQTGDPSSLLSRYRQLIRVRKASPALRLGGLSRLPTDDAGVLSYLRADPAETVLVAHNVRADPVTATVALPGTTAADAVLVDSGAAISAAGGDSWSVTLPGRKSGIWRLGR